VEDARKTGAAVKSSAIIDRRISVAPMMDWTDRHCRFFLRQFSPRALLYTEMITAAAILRGDRERLLRFSAAEQPVALQIGGSDPAQLAIAARAGEDVGYREINLNCGCPSDRVSSGSFGACLMETPDVVAECVSAMCAAVSIPVTVKMRIGVVNRHRDRALDASAAMLRFDDLDFEHLADFTRQVIAAGSAAVIVHARKAVLGGLSPHDNRTVPPLRYDIVQRLRAEVPATPVIVNGGMREVPPMLEALLWCDGVMIGREAYHRPWLLSDLHQALFPEDRFSRPGAAVVLDVMRDYARAEVAAGTRLSAITRHMLGLLTGRPGAKAFRQLLSLEAQRGLPVDDLFSRARELVP
jgi:tRNA-dihydrouridine synthase A